MDVIIRDIHASVHLGEAVMEEFDAIIKKHEGIDGAYVEIPFDVEKVLGTKRVKVNATFDSLPYRGSIVRMGGCYLIGINQDLRKRMGKNPGDTIRVTVEKDEEERKVELPEDFAALLSQHDDAGSNFDKLSFSKKKEYAQWISGAKKVETREVRMEKALQLLKEGKPLK